MTTTDTNAAAPGKATPKAIIAYFEEGSRKVELKELMALKKADPKGYDDIANGIGSGSLTY